MLLQGVLSRGILALYVPHPAGGLPEHLHQVHLQGFVQVDVLHGEGRAAHPLTTLLYADLERYMACTRTRVAKAFDEMIRTAQSAA